jgi:LuxR family maltose regulon positive regulatory protein
MTVDPLLSTKLHSPTPRSGLVARSRLVARLQDGLRLGRRLTLVSAPPGFGKTSAIQEWIGRAGRPVAWLSVDEGDNDAPRFLRYLVAALSQADERVGQVLQASSSVPLQAPLQAPLIALINCLAEIGADLGLVLDDYHCISDSTVHELVAFLLTNQPSGLHTVIGTREDPPLPLARMRARDQVTEIRERDLRFTTEEAAAFLNQTMNLGLSSQSVAALVSRTEGWITGLQLAGLALRQPAVGSRLQKDADEFVAAFAGDDRYVVDYLMAEVLDRQPEPVRRFLRQTSILDRLSASLCDALTGREDSQGVLEQLVDENLFLVPLDNRREWYRYHVLFGQVLRLTLAAPEGIELHRKASAWLQAHGHEESALHHTRLAAEMSAASSASRRHVEENRRLGEPLVEPLSERELEVLHLIADGFSNAEIATTLVIAQGTVKRHINNIYGKLAVQSRTRALVRARELGLL